MHNDDRSRYETSKRGKEEDKEVHIIIIIIKYHHHNHCRSRGRKSVINNGAATINDYMRSLDTQLTHSFNSISIHIWKWNYMFPVARTHINPQRNCKTFVFDGFNDNDIWRVCYNYYYYYMALKSYFLSLGLTHSFQSSPMLVILITSWIRMHIACANTLHQFIVEFINVYDQKLLHPQRLYTPHSLFTSPNLTVFAFKRRDYENWISGFMFMQYYSVNSLCLSISSVCSPFNANTKFLSIFFFQNDLKPLWQNSPIFQVLKFKWYGNIKFFNTITYLWIDKNFM